MPVSLFRLKDLKVRYRRAVVTAIHLTLIVLANGLAFLLRFDGSFPPVQREMFLKTIFFLLLIRGVTFLFFRLYEGLWRYTGIWDLRNIIVAVSTSTAAFAMLVFGVLGIRDYPRSVLAIDTLLLICFLGGVRLTRRIYRELGNHDRDKKILIFGAGDAGEMIVRDMKNNGFYNYDPVGFVDDDPAKVGQSIHGVQILGTRKDLGKIFASEQPAEVLVAMPKENPSKIREVVKALEPFKVPIKTLPSLRDLLDGKVSANQIRNLAVEDLLDRAAIGLNPEPIRHLVEGKRVLVTGAGGSIGAELCHQIAALNPARLILFERHENSLYEIANGLLDQGIGKAILEPMVGDVVDEGRVDAAFRDLQPDLIFHAAAHKHVPLMELNPCEAVKNNVTGTQVVAEAAVRYGAKRFVLISSDKAVNPSSVMGATKRVAEFLIRSMNHGAHTIFAAVRFGNVLGSAGSVVPRFLEQIKAGGPVTVTHPEMRRYFMLIPEAVQLVLHAAALASAGEIYVLDMGEQIRVLELARNLIRLTGFIPDQDIPITFIGLRPGEKLSEALINSDETVEPSGVEKVLRVKGPYAAYSSHLAKKIKELNRLTAQNDEQGALTKLREIVPNYSPHWHQ